MEIFLLIIIFLGIFILCRELVCWYFKLNEISKELKSIREALEHGIKKTGNPIIREYKNGSDPKKN